MTEAEFIAVCRQAQAEGHSELRGTLAVPYRGVRQIVLRNLQGSRNGNPHDVWVESRTGIRTIGRAFLGSKRRPANTEGWPQRIAQLERRPT